MKCVACQRVIADGSKFCPYCGNLQPDTGGDSGVVAGVVPPAFAPTVAPPAGTPPPGSSVLPPAPPAPPTYPGAPGAPRAAATAAGGPASSRATMAMVAGIGSIVLSLSACCCWGLPSLLAIPVAIFAFVSGRNELEDIAGGFASAAGQGAANTGKTTGLIGIILGALCAIGGIVVGLVAMSGNHG